MTNMARVLKGLLQRTEEGKLSWRASVSGNEFAAAIDTIAVVVKSVKTGGLLGTDRYKLEVLNEQGVTVEALESQDEYGFVPSDRVATSEQHGEMSRLFTLARRSGLDTDATLEKLANRLENFQ